jgi:hypothetical protein
LWFVKNGDDARRRVPSFIKLVVIPELNRVLREGNNEERVSARAALERLGNRPTSGLTDEHALYDYSPYDE